MLRTRLWQVAVVAVIIAAAIVFAVPELDDKIERHMRSADPSHRYEVEIALWTGLGAHHPAALVQYFNIYTGYSLRVDVDPKGFIDDLPMFEDKKITFEGRHSAGNKLGPIKSRRFVFEDVECVAFSQTFGHSEYGVGTKRVLGYYCADPGDPLSKTMLSSILNSVDIK